MTDVKRGQMADAKAQSRAKNSRPRSKTDLAKFGYRLSEAYAIFKLNSSPSGGQNFKAEATVFRDQEWLPGRGRGQNFGLDATNCKQCLTAHYSFRTDYRAQASLTRI